MIYGIVLATLLPSTISTQITSPWRLDDLKVPPGCWLYHVVSYAVSTHIYTYLYISNIHKQLCDIIYIYTGRTKVALVELPTVNMSGFFFCTPCPLRILAWSFVVPRSNFHPPKAFNLIDLKAGDNWPSHTCHTKWTWKCDPRLTEMDALSSCQEA